MTASNSKAASADKNLKTNAESRRASKPLMEKRRRARINQSLAVLKSLIVDSQKIEGQKHSKLEKADILEMTVSHLQSVKKSDEQKFMEGFEECFSESVRYLENSKIDSTTIDKLAEHLKHFQTNMDPSVFNPSNAISSKNDDGESISLLEKRSVSAKLLKFTLGSDVDITKRTEKDNNASKFPLHVPPRFPKLEFPKGNGSSPSSCVSPSLSVTISNDSNNNNNNFTSEGDCLQSLSSPSSSAFGYNGQSENIPLYQQSLHSPASNFSHSGSTISNMNGKGEEQYVLNLSTNALPYTSLQNCPRVSSVPLEESMDYEPLDFSKPLNLSKHPIGYRLSEDGVWRPW